MASDLVSRCESRASEGLWSLSQLLSPPSYLQLAVLIIYVTFVHHKGVSRAQGLRWLVGFDLSF